MRFHKLAVCSFAALVLSTFLAAAQTSRPKHQVDVPYVPTTEEAVKGVLKLADVRRTDIVYDLGCGDGRIAVGSELISTRNASRKRKRMLRKLAWKSWCGSRRTIYSTPTFTKPPWLRFFC